MISADLDRTFCNLLNGWHALEQKLGGEVVVDFNLPSWQGSTQFETREQVLAELDQIIDSDEAKTDRGFFQRVYGLRAYLQDILNNKTTPIDDYLPATMGFKSIYLPDSYVNEMREKARESLAKIGVDFNDALKGMAAQSRIVPVDDIPDWFKSNFTKAVGKAMRIFPTPPQLLEPNVTIFENDSSTIANITGEGRQLHLSFNRTRMKERSEEMLDSTLRHEILGHGIQMSLVSDKIESGQWPSNRGITCMQGIESFQSEALAEYASVYYGDNDAVTNAANDLQFAQRIVSVNFEYMVFHGSESDDAICKYYMEQLPFRDEDYTRKRIENTRSTSLRRCYTPVYGPCLMLSTRIMESLGDKGQAEFMRGMYEGYMDPTDIEELGAKLGAPKTPYFESCRPAAVQAVADKASLALR